MVRLHGEIAATSRAEPAQLRLIIHAAHGRPVRRRRAGARTLAGYSLAIVGCSAGAGVWMLVAAQAPSKEIASADGVPGWGM